MSIRYQIIITNTRGESVQDYGGNLERAKQLANHYRKPFFRNTVKDASVYEVITHWSEDRSSANAIYKKVY